MKRASLQRALAALCAAALIGACALGLFRLLGLAQLTYARAEQYTAGDAEISAPVKNLEIEWTSGRVSIVYHSGGTVSIAEKSDAALSENDRLQWLLEGDTLRVRYEKPGFRLFSFHKKELIVVLPEGTALDSVRVSVTSGAVEIPALNAESLTLNATSGDIRAAVSARNIEGKLTSGSLELQLTAPADAVALRVTSGSLRLEGEEAHAVRLESASGRVYAAVKYADQWKATSASGPIEAVIGQAKEAELGSASGNVTLNIVAFDALSIHTASGDVRLLVPEETGFTAQFSTASGRVDQLLPMTRQDSPFLCGGGDAYRCGDGAASLKISTASGDISVLPWQK